MTNYNIIMHSCFSGKVNSIWKNALTLQGINYLIAGDVCMGAKVLMTCPINKGRVHASLISMT